MNEKLQILSEMLPLINDLIHDDCYLTVLAADSTVVGYDIPAGRSPLVTVGKPFQDPTGAFEEVVRSGKVKHNMLPKEVMGEVCEGILTPIKEGNQVIGVLTCTHSLGDQMQYMDMTKEFENSMKTITVSIGDVINGMENMFQMLTDMNDHTVTVDSDVKNATDVVSKIASNASRSNILALNASIEAARSGEAGRGFAVVAGEMGKLANDSGKSAKEIGVTLDAISHHLKEISDSIHNTDQVAKDYLEGVNSVKEELEKTLQIANALKKNVQG